MRWRRLFRSDHPAALTRQDHARLARLGIGRVLDFRGEAERAAQPYALEGATQHSLAIEPAVAARVRERLVAGLPASAGYVRELMRDQYRVLAGAQVRRFAGFFVHLLETDSPVLFHCTAGKDRTGFAAALLLLALGVPRAQVMRDYLLSNTLYRRPPSPPDDPLADARAVLSSVEAGFLEAALQVVDDKHGGIEGYLRGALGLDAGVLDELAARYLE